jgi:hypothetical protein
MRDVTQEEGERWTALAEQHGFTDEAGGIALGRFTVESIDEQSVLLRVITPIVAGGYTDGLEKKEPPILFDRTPNGQIIIPGRWWQHLFEKVSDDADLDEESSKAAAAFARTSAFGDALLPLDFETISFLVPDGSGNPVVHEALPPEGTIRVELHAKNEEDDPA